MCLFSVTVLTNWYSHKVRLKTDYYGNSNIVYDTEEYSINEHFMRTLKLFLDEDMRHLISEDDLAELLSVLEKIFYVFDTLSIRFTGSNLGYNISYIKKRYDRYINKGVYTNGI